jgi:hypothetical protein|tara:strand:+ start:69 stop:281 length:213 start_codon:yes stop_codon:yes gene_type:complete
MSDEDKRRWSVMLTKRQIQTVVSSLDTSDGRKDSEVVQLIVDLFRRLQQIDTSEEQERRLADYPEIDVGI